MARPEGTHQFPDCIVCTNPKIHEHTAEEIAAAERQREADNENDWRTYTSGSKSGWINGPVSTSRGKVLP